MKTSGIDLPEGYDPEAQRTVGTLAAALDDQLRRLLESVADLTTEALEWQSAPGRNTIGMLLAHIAVAEAWWLNAGAEGITDREQVRVIVQSVIGIQPRDDGMPAPADGTHPEALRGKRLADYLDLLECARVATHAALGGWTDADLDEPVQLRDHRPTRGWILYHVLEHFAAHYGQILLLKRDLCDAGLLPAEDRPPS